MQFGKDIIIRSCYVKGVKNSFHIKLQSSHLAENFSGTKSKK